MVYKAIGITSNLALESLEIVYVHFQERGGQWSHELLHTARYKYSSNWLQLLRKAAGSTASEFVLMDRQFGKLIGDLVNRFIEENSLSHRVDLVATDGHTIFNQPAEELFYQLGDGAFVAAITGLPVVSNLRSLDTAFGGAGTPLLSLVSSFSDEESEYKDALVTAHHGVLRWREEYTMLASGTGARRNSIGGALWLGGEA